MRGRVQGHTLVSENQRNLIGSALIFKHQAMQYSPHVIISFRKLIRNEHYENGNNEFSPIEPLHRLGCPQEAVEC